MTNRIVPCPNSWSTIVPTQVPVAGLTVVGLDGAEQAELTKTATATAAAKPRARHFGFRIVEMRSTGGKPESPPTLQRKGDCRLTSLAIETLPVAYPSSNAGVIVLRSSGSASRVSREAGAT